MHRILQATSAQNHKSIQSITNDLDKIEKQINTPEIYDEERVYLEENIFKQKVHNEYFLIFFFTQSSFSSFFS